MASHLRRVVACWMVAVACVATGAGRAEAQQPLRVEGIYPRQLPRGQSTVVNLVVPTVDEVSPEITPSQGVSVTRAVRGDSFQGAHTWWAITVEVDAGAAPGERTLTLRFPGERAISTNLTVPSHVPQIAALRVVGAGPNGVGLDVEVSARDDSDDLGMTPHVWFFATCGDMPVPGVVPGTVVGRANGATVVRAGIPRPAAPRGASAPVKCDLQVRVADASGFESNALSAAVDHSAFGQAAWPQGPWTIALADTGAADWEEVVSREERFTAVFPGRPTVHESTWMSQYGAVVPARVYGLSKGQSRYSLTVVNYNPIERLLVERSRSCPPGANTCQGIADWGVGYWKTDIRGAIFYAISKYLERDARVTTLIWNGIALVQGVEMRLTNNKDQSRTFASIYMHENRLLIIEATMAAGEAPPVAFNESVNWLDEQGRPVRYQATYVNIPDVPKPLPRGAPAPQAR